MLGRKDKQPFNEKLNLFIAGNVDMYANSIIRDCVPQGEYLETLGMGSEKLVLLYKDMLLNQKRVLNIRLPDLSKETEKRFIRSIRIMTSISDGELLNGKIPPFPLIYDLRENPPFFVCEYIKGVTLRTYIEKKGAELSLMQKLLIFKKIALGVQLLHLYDVVHRDLKPDNIIIVDTTGMPKIIDFGIAMSCYESVLTRTDAILGTPGYAAPEQMTDAGNVDHRADVYALAKVLYFIIAGDDEFSPEKLPVELLCVIPKAWQEDKERRHEDAYAFLVAVAEVFPLLKILDEQFSAPHDISVAKAFSDLLILFGGNVGKVKRLLNVSVQEWDILMTMAKNNIVSK